MAIHTAGDADCWKGTRFSDNPDLERNQLFFGGGISACPGRFFAIQELLCILSHFLKSFHFDASTLRMTKRLPYTIPDGTLGPDVPGSTHKILDADGKILVGKWPGVKDAGVEAINGLLTVCDLCLSGT